jgi:hypothetical protein
VFPILLAGLIAGAIYAAVTASAARVLVASVQRQDVGAILFGGVALALLPVAAAIWLVSWRVFRRLLGAAPAS